MGGNTTGDMPERPEVGQQHGKKADFSASSTPLARKN
jgi:hypothetical protein